MEKENQGMTDRQFLNHLRELLAVAERSATLEEFKNELRQLIEQYTNYKRLNRASFPACNGLTFSKSQRTTENQKNAFRLCCPLLYHKRRKKSRENQKIFS